MQNALAEPIKPPWPLTPAQRPIWREIVAARARDEWQPVDLRFAWELAAVVARLHAEDARLAEEGSILDGRYGAKINPRDGIVRGLSRRAVWLATYLRVHPASVAEYPQLVR